MIPKIIHYCWLSNDPLPKDIQEYINSWKEKLPDYQIMKWDFSIFDKSSSKWVEQAFDQRKYAFASDFIRLYAVYNYGGIYLDSDVQVLKSFDPFLCLETMIGWQCNKDGLEIACFGAEKGTEWVRKCLDYYDGREFINPNGSLNTKTLPLIIEETLKANGYKLVDVDNVTDAVKITGNNEIPVFAQDFFSPKDFNGRLTITERTVSIHHFVASWVSPAHRIIRKMVLLLGGPKLRTCVAKLYARLNAFLKD